METHTASPTILIVDDDKSDRAHARHALQPQDYRIYEAANGQRLREILAGYPVDLILLDLHMPGEDGLTLIPCIRDQTDAPIIIVSGTHNPSEKRSGLHAGADDYIDKPFYPEDLQARIHANLRRYRQSPAAHRAQPPPMLGPWLIDHDIADIRGKDGRALGLTFQEFRLIDKLAQAGGRTLSRGELSTQEGGRCVDIHVTRIRKKLNDPTIIQTVRGLGYRICGDPQS